MGYEHLKEYIYIILDMEKNVYIQKQTLENLYQRRNSLGIQNRIDIPKSNKAKADYVEYMLRAGLVCAAIGFVIGIFIRWGDFWNSSGIFAIILAPLFGLFIALIAGFAGGIVIGPLIAISVRKEEQDEYDSEYQFKMSEYDRLKKADENRVKKELIYRSRIQNDIEELERQYSDSKRHLETMYGRNIIHPKYRHNIIAISAFYQYLSEKRTYCLEFDQSTGDRGAYNIYNEEVQRGVIISQLNLVLTKLDQVINNQEILQRTMIDANNKINYLSNDINNMNRQLSSSTKEQTAIQNYNAERMQAELEFMNTMNIIFNWK